MTYKGAIDEVISLANNSLMPVIFKPSLKKIAETLEMERPKVLTLSEVETYANEHNYVLWTEEMSEKALALIKADRSRPKGQWIEREDYNGDPFYDCSVCGESFATMEGTPAENLYNFCPNCGADMIWGLREVKPNE